MSDKTKPTNNKFWLLLIVAASTVLIMTGGFLIDDAVHSKQLFNLNPTFKIIVGIVLTCFWGTLLFLTLRKILNNKS